MSVNTVRQENQRTYETVPLGALKVNSTTGALEAPGAATVTPTGQVWNSGTQQIVDQGSTFALGTSTTSGAPQYIAGYPIIGLSSMTGIYLGSKVSDAGSLKFFPVAANAEVIGINEKAKTIWVNVAPVRSIAEAIEQNNKAIATKESELTTTLKVDNFTEIATGTPTATSFSTATKFELTSQAIQFADNVTFTLNILEGTATAATTELWLYTSFDGGNTWVEVGKTASLAVTATGTGAGTISIKEKLQGQRFAFAVKQATAANKASGYFVVACDRTAPTVVRSV